MIEINQALIGLVLTAGFSVLLSYGLIKYKVDENKNAIKQEIEKREKEDEKLQAQISNSNKDHQNLHLLFSNMSGSFNIMKDQVADIHRKIFHDNNQKKDK